MATQQNEITMERNNRTIEELKPIKHQKPWQSFKSNNRTIEELKHGKRFGNFNAPVNSIGCF